MRHVVRKFGTVAFWLGWPFYLVYFRLSKRTRVLLTRGDEVLVVANWVSDGRWNLPGGGLKRSEDPVQGALRELYEEVGIKLQPGDLQLLGMDIYQAHGHRYAYFQFAAEAPADVLVRRQWHEVADARWVDYRTLTAQNATPDVLAMLRLWHA